MAVTIDQIAVEITAVTGQYDRAMVQVAAVTIRNMEAAEGAAKKGSDAIGKALEGIASRVPGLVKGLAEGENALHLFLEEAARLLTMFGPWGAVAGAAVEVLDTLAMGFIRASEEAAAAAAAAVTYETVVGRLGSTAEETQDRIGRMSREMLETEKRRIEIALRNEARKLKETRDQVAAEVRDMIADIPVFSRDGRTWEERAIPPLEALERFEAGGSIAALRGELDRLMQVTDEQASRLIDLATTEDTLNSNSMELSGTLNLVEQGLGKNAGAADEMAGAFSRAAGEVGFLAGAMDALREARARMLPQTGLSFGGQSVTFGTTDLQTALANFVTENPGTNTPGASGIPPRPDVGGRRGGGGKAQRNEGPTEQDRQAADQLRADDARAEQLTKNVMTAQEQYNETLREYERLRDNGALKEEAYLRLVRSLNAEHNTYVEGIQAIGQAIQGGIQGATSFSDALLKIADSLAQMIAQAAFFGQGPLGKLFDGLFGTSGGIFNLTGAITGALGGGGLVQPAGSPIAVPIPGRPPGMAAGGQALPGRIYEVGETGREWFAPSVPGQVIPNSVIKAAAGGGTGSGPPINFNISLAGANGDRAIAEIAAAAVKKGLQQVPEINRQHRIRFA
ncbi:hypothetical protein KXS07_26850 [Inquilinus limosus]|uniref:hypothetical protein n=1 Tax=Inquilinus limosus TaxID=171674 RepID=UPI003F151316